MMTLALHSMMFVFFVFDVIAAVAVSAVVAASAVIAVDAAVDVVAFNAVGSLLYVVVRLHFAGWFFDLGLL